MPTIHDDLYDDGKPSLRDVVPTKNDTLTVCNTTYHCVKDAEHGSRWSTTKAARSEDESGDCKVDSLHALAKSLGCVDSIRNAKDACKAAKEPCLTDGTNHYCIVGTAALPNTFYGDLSCSDFRYDERVHDRARRIHFGDNAVDMVVFEPMEAEGAAQAEPLPLAAAASSTIAAAASPTHARCEWWQPRPILKAACNVDADCEPSSEAMFSAWWNVAHKDLDGKPLPTLGGFLQKEKHDAANTQLHFDESHGAVTSKTPPASKFQMRQQLKGLYDDDASFRQSVKETLFGESRYTSVMGDLASCTDGRCRSSRASASQTVFDRTRDVPLVLSEGSDGSVGFMYQGLDEKMHALRSQSCDVSSPPPGCDLDLPTVDGLVLTKDLLIASAYRVVLPDDTVHLVNNAVTVPRGRDDDATRSSCAVELCSRNSGRGACPAPHCRLEGDVCKPSGERVSAIRIHDAIV